MAAIKKLGEVCVITMGQSPCSESYNDIGKGMPFFQGCSDFGKLNPHITTYCDMPKKTADINDVLISVRAPIGTLNIADIECCIGRGLASIREIDGITCYKYLYYFLLKSKKELQEQGIGATFKAIGKDVLFNFPIVVPPLSEQSRIVEELDLLSNIIEKKRQQLSELDNLAQSIFYDMFGDPVTNEKGWEVKAIKEVAPQKPYKGDVPSINGKYWLLNLDMIVPNTGEIIDKCYFEKEEIGNSTIAFDRTNVLYSKLRPYLNKVVIPNDIGYATTELVPLCPLVNVLNREFLAHLLRSYSFVSYIENISGKI